MNNQPTDTRNSKTHFDADEKRNVQRERQKKDDCCFFCPISSAMYRKAAGNNSKMTLKQIERMWK